MVQRLALPALRALPRAVSLRVGMEPGSSPLSDTPRMLRNEVETPNFGNQIAVRNLLPLSRSVVTQEVASRSDSCQIYLHHHGDNG
jgi:hypothetical protein